MKKMWLISLALMMVAGCHSPQSGAKPPTKTNFQGQNEAFQKEVARLREARAVFAERYKRYECKMESVPRTDEFKGPGENFKSNQFGDHLVLKLKLGAAIHVDGTPYGPTRTKSQYQLYWNSKLVAEAESLFSLPLSSERGTHNRFFYNPADNTLVVFDDLCWSTMRFCVFERLVGLNQGYEWKTRYFAVPDSPSIGVPEMGQILGVGNGNIYMLIGNQSYAFPFDDFLLSKLEFTVG